MKLTEFGDDAYHDWSAKDEEEPLQPSGEKNASSAS